MAHVGRPTAVGISHLCLWGLGSEDVFGCRLSSCRIGLNKAQEAMVETTESRFEVLIRSVISSF